jgi:hypothetical protein
MQTNISATCIDWMKKMLDQLIPGKIYTGWKISLYRHLLSENY